MEVRKTKFTCEHGHTDMWLYPTGKIRCHSCQEPLCVLSHTKYTYFRYANDLVPMFFGHENGLLGCYRALFWILPDGGPFITKPPVCLLATAQYQEYTQHIAATRAVTYHGPDPTGPIALAAYEKLTL